MQSRLRPHAGTGALLGAYWLCAPLGSLGLLPRGGKALLQRRGEGGWRLVAEILAHTKMHCTGRVR